MIIVTIWGEVLKAKQLHNQSKKIKFEHKISFINMKNKDLIVLLFFVFKDVAIFAFISFVNI